MSVGPGPSNVDQVPTGVAGWEFQCTVGLLSLLSNLFLMRLLVGTLQLPVLVANGLAVVTLACVNFLISDRLVFVHGSGR